MNHRNALAFAVVLVACASSSAAAQRKPAAPPRITASLASDAIGREPKTFIPMVGNWSVVQEAGKKVVFVDGRIWKKGQPAGGLADKARAIYGKNHEEFIESIQAFAYYPIAVFRDVDNFHDGDISVDFMMVGGTLDRCAGILFNVKPNGDYLALRFNGTEDNVVLWTFNNGKRTFVKRGTGSYPLELGTWHNLRVHVQGTAFTAFLDGKLAVEFELKEPVSGKVGLWSKTDSMSEFANFVVMPSSGSGAL
jgi:hypothetical protein